MRIKAAHMLDRGDEVMVGSFGGWVTSIDILEESETDRPSVRVMLDRGAGETLTLVLEDDYPVKVWTLAD